MTTCSSQGRRLRFEHLDPQKEYEKMFSEPDKKGGKRPWASKGRKVGHISIDWKEDCTPSAGIYVNLA